MTEHNGAPADLKRTITVKDRTQLSVGPDIIGPDIVALRFTVRGFNPYDAAIKELNSCVEAPRRDLEAEKVRAPGDRRRIYDILRLQAFVDQDRSVRITGVFDTTGQYLPDALKDGPEWLAPRAETGGIVVTSDNIRPCTS